MINTGGYPKSIGKRSDQLNRRTRLKQPRSSESLLASFSILVNTVATSGDYQKYFKQNGKCYNHNLAPKIGYPATSSSMSTTVITKNLINADALSTVLFFLGSEKGMTLLYSINDTEDLIINIEGETRVSKNMNSIKGFTLKSFKNGIRH